MCEGRELVCRPCEVSCERDAARRELQRKFQLDLLLNLSYGTSVCMNSKFCVHRRVNGQQYIGCCHHFLSSLCRFITSRGEGKKKHVTCLSFLLRHSEGMMQRQKGDERPVSRETSGQPAAASKSTISPLSHL